MTDTSLAIELQDVSFVYGQSDAPAVSRVSLSVPRGQWLTILGHNGSGKSTLSRILAAVSAPSSGTVTLLGHHVMDEGNINRIAYHHARRDISYVTQNPEDHIVATTVKDDVAFEPENLGYQPEHTAHTVYTSLAVTGMSQYADANPLNLSGGQQQRVAIASALAPSPQLLILDEPFAFVDTASRNNILESLKKAHDAGTTIVLITHHAYVAKYGDRVIDMSQGTIVRDSTSQDWDALSRDEDITITPDALHKVNIDTSMHAKGDVIVETHNLGFAYPDAQPVIENLDFSIARGEFLALAGPNGAGKSTLVNLISGAAKPTSGTLISHAERIGFLMQKAEQQLFADTVYNDIAFGPRNNGLSEDEVLARVHDVCKFLGIIHLLENSPWELSGGQQRLVALAGVLVMKPDLLILDEPTASLDVDAADKILTLIKRLQLSGTTIVMISHSLTEIEKYATRAIVLEQSAHNAYCTSRRSEESYIDAHAPQTRFDPRVTTVLALLAMISTFTLHSIWMLALGVGATVLYATLSGIRFTQIVRSLHGFWIFIAVMGLFNLFFVQSGRELVHEGIVRITTGGAMAAILYAGRFALVGVIAIATLHMLPANRITDAVEAMSRPLKHIGIPVHELALMSALTIRFMPILTRDFKNLATAQSLRGSHILHGSLPARMRSAQALLVPAIANALRHADKLSMALDTRGFDADAHRIPWRTMQITWRDYALIAGFATYGGGIIALSFI
ncbi:energy-coupling factor transporter ATPase [Alloscardovia venturai]|uniref:Energy-coupling factor transporter ATPase n=1 Tax=Alloscardovia venturai TaxID=1769421 RepID=A0ABW2Y4T8_9BIFI